MNVLISGSGIAGTVFAFWLLRANPNANITIVERDPTLRLTGASVDIRSSAVDIIKWMGAEAEIRKHTTKEEGVQFVKANGKPIATFRATGRTDIQTMTSEFEIFRGALAEIFVNPIKERVKLVFNETVESYEQLDDGVNVHLKNSKEVKKYDVLVAADGLGSKIRAQMLQAPARDQIHDEGAHVAYFTIKKDLLEGSRLAKWHNDTRGRCIFVRPDPSPEGLVRGHLMNITLQTQTAERERLNKAMSEGHESYMTLLEELFADADCWLAPEVLRSMRESEDFYCSIFGQVRSPKLHAGRVVLLGDAGYATPGIGTSLAIMGGYVLAGELLTHPEDVSAALQAYEELMVPFVKTQQGNFGGIQYMNPQTWWGVWIRDAILGFVDMIRLDRLVIAVMSMVGFKEKMLAMPDYPWPAEGEKIKC